MTQYRSCGTLILIRLFQLNHTALRMAILSTSHLMKMLLPVDCIGPGREDPETTEDPENFPIFGAPRESPSKIVTLSQHLSVLNSSK